MGAASGAEVNKVQQLRYGRSLKCGPWIWPAQGTEARAEAEQLVSGGVPEAAVGAVALVTARQEGSEANLWGYGLPKSGQAKSLGAVAKHSRLQARAALPRALPLLWRSIIAAEAEQRDDVVRLATRQFDAGHLAPITLVDGASLGLAMALSLASRVLGQALPADLIASATINAQGQIGPVGHLQEKLACVADEAPGISRFLLAKAQLAEAQQLNQQMNRRLKIVPIADLAAALAYVFGPVEELLIKQGHDDASRNELIEHMFLLALGDRQASVSWRPIASAAELALQTWPDLNAAQTFKLQSCQGIAQRHDGNRGGLDLPSAAQLSAIPQPLRTDFVAHLVQQATETRSPNPDDAAKLAEAQLCRGNEAFAAHLRLLGALGRMRAMQGKPQQALTLQREAALAWLERGMATDASYPLTEWMRLAGALHDPQAFAEAEDFHLRLKLRMAVESDAFVSNYVKLAWCRGLVQLGKAERSLGALRDLANNEQIEAHLRWSAARWLIQVLRASAALTEANKWLAALQAGATGDVYKTRYLRLVELDAALANGHDDDAILALKGFCEVERFLGPRMLEMAGLKMDSRAAGDYLGLWYFY